jgi:hypothetical protein
MLCSRSAKTAKMCQKCHLALPLGCPRPPRKRPWLLRQAKAVLIIHPPDPRPASTAQCSLCGPPRPRSIVAFLRGLSCCAVAVVKESWIAPSRLVSMGSEAASTAADACPLAPCSRHFPGSHLDQGLAQVSAPSGGRTRVHWCCAEG